MKLLTKLSWILAVAVLAVSCKKTDFDKTGTGEALGNFRLSSPATSTNLVLNAATPNVQVAISWSAAKPGVKTEPTYTWVAVAEDAENFDSPLLAIPSDNSGKNTSLTLSYQQIDDALDSKGIAEGGMAELKWTVIADNGTTKVYSQDIYNINITRFQDGATPFVLLGPVSSNSLVAIAPGSTTDSLKFNWISSSSANAANPVKYTVWFYKNDASSTPVFSILSNSNGGDTLLKISYKDFSDSLSANGFANLSAISDLKWTVVATSGGWEQQSDYTNQLTIAREVKLFLVGGSTPAGWDPPSSIRMIQDDRFPGTFYCYAKLTVSGSGLKFLSENSPWGTPSMKVFGDVDAVGNTGNITSDGGGQNILVPTDGVYRITADLTQNKYYLQTGPIGALGLVGAFQSWNPSGADKMNCFSPNKLILIRDISNNDQFKLHDGDQWDNSGNNKSRWYGIDPADSKLKIDGGSLDALKWTGATGPVRVIFDGADITNLKYDMSAASEMRVVGDGMQGVNAWSPADSPQMTYLGFGIWTITVDLIANKDIKFLAGNAWGAFDYEDNSGGSQDVGTERKIKWDGGGNFKTPAASGTYTIFLNEYNQTVSIN
jgi:starch-binding outer membrane protein SusE/F